MPLFSPITLVVTDSLLAPNSLVGTDCPGLTDYLLETNYLI